jgi:predicted RNA-binding Zn-ribbon protein involved in translation (DUF1610 family)
MFILITVLSILAIVAYWLFMKEKSNRLLKNQMGICPDCGLQSIEIKRAKGNGCSGTSTIIYHCANCGYEESFNEPSRGCSI